MTTRRRLVLAVLWMLSLLVAAHWSTHAQVATPPGTEIRFLKTPGTDGTAAGILLANFGGQWLPVKLDNGRLPDGNGLVPR